MKKNFLSFGLAVIFIAAVSCSGSQNNNQDNSGSQENLKVIYEAHLSALNSNVTGMQPNGNARFVIADDTMTVTIDMNQVPPNMQHWQHFHGFKNDSLASCPPQSADKNGDSIIDVIETEPFSGTTMVPFNGMPAHMDVGSDTYPEAGADSAYHYETKIPMDQLKAGFAKAFGDTLLDLDKRVLYIHGVPSNTKLPSSVASIADIPTQITLPIACGKIEKVNQ